jgi:hypothetical protein
LKEPRDTRDVEVAAASTMDESHATMGCLLQMPFSLASCLKWHHSRNSILTHKVKDSHRTIPPRLVCRPGSGSREEERFSVWGCYSNPISIVTFPLPTIYKAKRWLFCINGNFCSVLGKDFSSEECPNR